MLINKLLAFTQSKMRNIYNKSFFMQNLDWLIFVNIILLILTSTFASSDSIGYFAIFSIILTAIKVLIKPNERFSLSTGDKFLLIYFMFVIISLAGSSLFVLSLKGFCKTFVYIGFYVSFIHYIKDNINKLKYIFIALAVALLGETIIALSQNLHSVSEISGWQDVSRLNADEVMTRVYGSIKPYNPNLFGGYILAILPASLIFVFLPLYNKHYKTALCGLLLFLFGVITVFLTGCRGAYLGLFAELFFLALFVNKFLKPFYKKIYLAILGLLSTIAFFIMFSITSLRARIFSIFAMRNDSSNSFRFNVYNSCIEMFKDNWLLGIGLGNQNFREVYGLYMKTGFDALSAYNIYLEIAVESGIFALIMFLIFLFINLYAGIRYVLRRKNIYTFYILISIISIIGMLVHGFVDTVYFRPQIQFVFWMMIGVIRVLTSTRGAYVR